MIAATNKDRRAEANAHRFRTELFYRVSVTSLRNPAVREHRFKGSTGVPPHRFVVRQQIGRARAFLTTQEPSVVQISRIEGFRTPSHFATVFRRVTGVTPKGYRTGMCEKTGPAGKEDGSH